MIYYRYKIKKGNIMNKIPNKLTTEEWNFLTKLSETTGMDTWFTLTEIENGDKDAIYDLDNEKTIPLYDGLLDFAEGLVEEDLLEINNGIEIWNGICDKFLGGIHKF